MTSELYADMVGHSARRWPRAYDEVIGLSCPTNRDLPPSMRGCGAAPGELCVNPVTGRTRKAPCLVRSRAGGHAWASHPPANLDAPAPRSVENSTAPVAV